MVEHKTREDRLEEESEDDEIDERPDDLLDDVPSKPAITIKEINDNRYYYWQWRDGEKTRSQCKDPVNPDEWSNQIHTHPTCPTCREIHS